jgi:hypothetical protein
MKKIVFAGDSFTWGEGLQYYSGLQDVVFPVKHEFDPKVISNKQMEFIINNRFSTLVGNYFNTQTISRSENGGSNDCSLRLLAETPHTEISYIVFQITELYREQFEFIHNDKTIMLYIDSLIYNKHNLKEFFKSSKYLSNKENYDLFYNYYETNFKSFDEFQNYFIEQSLNRIKIKLSNFIENNIPIYFINWRNCYTPALLENSFFSNKLIQFKYLDKMYNDLEDLLNLDRPELTNQGVFQQFKICKNDSHPSLLGHKIIAENIINTLCLK